MHMQIAAIGQRSFNNEIMKRLLIIGVGLAVQVAVIVLLLISLQQPAPRSVIFTAVPSDPTACRIVKFEPFTEAWLKGFRQGSTVHAIQNPSQVLNCATLTRYISCVLKITGRWSNRSEYLLHVSPTFPPTDFTTIALISILTLIFDAAGITIFIRAQDRPTARVTYALFYTTSLMFSVFIAYGYDYLWINILTLFLTMMIRGLSTTFVCSISSSSRLAGSDDNALACFRIFLLLLPCSLFSASPLVLILSLPQAHGLLYRCLYL